MQAAGYNIRETDPFETTTPMIFKEPVSSPYITRIQLLWQRMREDVLLDFPPAPGMTSDKKTISIRLTTFTLRMPIIPSSSRAIASAGF